MNRTTTARLKNAVRRLNFALEIVQHSKGEYIVARMYIASRGKHGWQLQRDYASGPVAVTGIRTAGDILRHIEAMLDGIAAARGLPVPRSIYDGFIKRDPAPAAPVCDRCSAPLDEPISELESLSGVCEACERADCCPITGDEYGTPS